jgi:hypothetical protein
MGIDDVLPPPGQTEAEKFAWLKTAIAEGIASADRGELYEFNDAMMESIIAEGRALAAQRRHSGS